MSGMSASVFIAMVPSVVVALVASRGSIRGHARPVCLL